MMEMEPVYPEKLARRILARAIEVDRVRGDNYSLAEMRSIADEAGVSTVALDQALREMQPRSGNLAGSSPGRFGLVSVAAAGTAVGAITGVTDVTTHLVTSPLAVGILLVIAGVLAIEGDYRKPWRGFAGFQVRNTCLWVTYAATWTVAGIVAGGAGAVSTGIQWGMVALGWTVSAVVGGLLTAFRTRRERFRDSEGSEEVIPIKRLIAETLKRWVDAWAGRVGSPARHLATHPTPNSRSTFQTRASCFPFIRRSTFR